MSVSNADKKRFRAIGHKLKPIVIIAQKGLSENIREEIERALSQHELIKLKLAVPDRDQRRLLTDEICAAFGADCIQSIGQVILIYRAAGKPDPRLSNLKREVS